MKFHTQVPFSEFEKVCIHAFWHSIPALSLPAQGEQGKVFEICFFIAAPDIFRFATQL